MAALCGDVGAGRWARGRGGVRTREWDAAGSGQCEELVGWYAPHCIPSGFRTDLFSAGFLSTQHVAALAPPPLPLQILSEDANNTLNDECPGAPSPDPYTNAWLHRFAPPILYRLVSMAQGARLEEEDVRRLIGICVFESIAMARETHGKGKAKSKFCDLFSYEDWKEWEYWGDIEKYYKTGYVFSLPLLPSFA